MKKELGIFLSTGAGIRIAVLDSGVTPSALPVRGKAFDVFDCTATAEGLHVRKLPPGLASDRNGHGTIVQGCVLAAAPDATVDHYRILDENNQCDSTLLCYTLDHVLDQGYNIVNLSLGTRNEGSVPWLVSIMKRAYERNAVVVASASNVGNALYPARFTYCISVEAAALGGPLGLRYLPSSVIEFAGHGVEVEVRSYVDTESSTDFDADADLESRVDFDEEAHTEDSGAPKRVSGSSYAAAHVTGLCARLLEVDRGLSPLDVKILLREYARGLAEGGMAS